MARNATPGTLAEAVRKQLRSRARQIPPMWALTRLFHTMYYASLQHEEEQAIVFHVIYIDPDNPDPAPPERKPRDRWSFVPLKPRAPFSVDVCAKLAMATDPRASAFAVFHRRPRVLQVWGFIDQGQRLHEYLRHESDTGPERPGVFEASVVGPGHILVHCDYETLAELRVNKSVNRAVDVMARGQVAAAMRPMMTRLRRAVAKNIGAQRPDWWHERFVDSQWIACMCRLLLRMQAFKHGGTVLLLPKASRTYLRVKYMAKYQRLRRALVGYAASVAESNYQSQQVNNIIDDHTQAHMPVMMFLDHAIAEYDQDEWRSALNGALWFTAIVSRVDGAVVFGPNLELLGFGAMIVTPQEPSTAVIARDANASGDTRRVSTSRWGARHRSAIAFCSNVRGAIAFVVSQDGHVRAMTRVGGAVCVWENIRLLGYDFRASAKLAALHDDRP